ncbi:MAG: hypothetical protein AAGD38_02090 [Acidobacteriota bacterium]
MKTKFRLNLIGFVIFLTCMLIGPAIGGLSQAEGCVLNNAEPPHTRCFGFDGTAWRNRPCNGIPMDCSL